MLPESLSFSTPASMSGPAGQYIHVLVFHQHRQGQHDCHFPRLTQNPIRQRHDAMRKTNVSHLARLTQGSTPANTGWYWLSRYAPILGSRLMILTMLRIAPMASVRALMLGPACDRAMLPIMTLKKTFVTSPTVWTCRRGGDSTPCAV
jgi:hypothetical protein